MIPNVKLDIQTLTEGCLKLQQKRWSVEPPTIYIKLLTFITVDVETPATLLTSLIENPRSKYF